MEIDLSQFYCSSEDRPLGKDNYVFYLRRLYTIYKGLNLEQVELLSLDLNSKTERQLRKLVKKDLEAIIVVFPELEDRLRKL